MPISRIVHYSGRVQGVGFRATVEAIARAHPVAGWVKNLADGSVRLSVEGSEEAVELFLADIRAHFQFHIDEEQIEEREPTGEYRTFSIRY